MPKNKPIYTRKVPHTAFILIGFLVVTNLATFYASQRGAEATDECGSDYTLINPRFKCGRNAVISKRGYAELRAELKALIEQEKAAGNAREVAVWFRDLEEGPTLGVNERRDFIPASLLKLPLAMTFFDLAENDPGLLQQRIIYSGTKGEVPTQAFKPNDPVQRGRSYTISELITHTLTHSDNVAAQVLYEYLLGTYGSTGPLSQTYRDLGILEPGTDLNMAAVSAKGYGSIFRLLYNASFLSTDSSNALLSLLTQSGLPDGLPKGVPGDISVAHKFGERYLANGGKQLHDCGIVYYPGNAYQLCIMTEGRDFNELENIIGKISKAVYREIDSRRID